MSVTLWNNEATTDPDVERICPGTVRLLITVSNAQATLTIGQPTDVAGPVDYQPAAPYSPGFYGLDRRCNAIKVKSTKAGTPAVVTIVAMTPADLPA